MPPLKTKRRQNDLTTRTQPAYATCSMPSYLNAAHPCAANTKFPIMTSDGKDLERLVYFIQKSIAPGATIKINDKILGKKSKSPRQIDVSVREKIGHTDILIVLECKDHAVRIDVKELEAFLGVIKDVGAHKGIMVSRLGFTSGARNLASESGIDLYSLDDILEEEGIEKITIPVLLKFTGIKFYQWKMSGTAPIRIGPMEDTLPLHFLNGQPAGSAINLVHKRWNERLIPHVKGEYRDIVLASKDVYAIKDFENDVYYPINVRATIGVESSFFFGQIEMEAFKNYKDELKGEVIGKIFKSTAVSYDMVEKLWQKVEDPRKLPLQPKLILNAEDYYKVEDIPRPSVGSA